MRNLRIPPFSFNWRSSSPSDGADERSEESSSDMMVVVGRVALLRRKAVVGSEGVGEMKSAQVARPASAQRRFKILV